MLYEHFKKLLQKRLLDFGEDAIQRKVKLLKVRRKNDISDKFAVNVIFDLWQEEHLCKFLLFAEGKCLDY